MTHYDGTTQLGSLRYLQRLPTVTDHCGTGVAVALDYGAQNNGGCYYAHTRARATIPPKPGTA
jgi:hypothetical protein